MSLVPIYYMGANYFECGHPWLYATLGYLCGDFVCEWACAVGCCVCVAVAVLSIDWLYSASSQMVFDGQTAEREAIQPTRLVLLLLGGALVVCLLGTPSVLYAALLGTLVLFRLTIPAGWGWNCLVAGRLCCHSSDPGSVPSAFETVLNFDCCFLGLVLLYGSS
jgi:hypothetical protein